MTHLAQDISVVAEETTMTPSPGSAGRWMECLSNLDPKFGGLSTVVPQLGSKLACEHGFRIDIAAFSRLDETHALTQRSELHGCHWPASRTAWLSSNELRKRFFGAVEQTDGLHIHGIWETHATVAAKTAWSAKKPYVVSAHGMLEPWAISQKRFKKTFYAALLERANLHRAVCLHALTLFEAEDYRRFGCLNPIAVIPNAVELPATVDSSLFMDSFPDLSDRRLVLFMGRLHPKKGLELLIAAWAALAARFRDATLVLAGPDENDYRARLEKLVRDHGLYDRIIFTGMLETSMKWSALASAHAFVLPSYSEGFSVAVLEAMGMGLPVIVSEECHFPEITKDQTGWIIQPTMQELSTALEEMLQNSPAANAEIGNRGRRVVQERFSWNVVARQMAELYNWAQSGSLPQTFELMEATA